MKFLLFVGLCVITFAQDFHKIEGDNCISFVGPYPFNATSGNTCTTAQ